MDLSTEEMELLRRIADHPYRGGGYPRAGWIELLCRTKRERAVLASLCRKGLVETGLGGTVAGDPYDACWLTSEGRAVAASR
jgi:hypothetical protein